MGAVVCCPSCGHVHQVILSDAEYAARFPVNGGQPAVAAAPAPQPAQPPRQSEMGNTLCARCGVNKVNRRRDGSWFATCFSCRG